MGCVDAVISAKLGAFDEIRSNFFRAGQENKKSLGVTHPVAWECNHATLDIPPDCDSSA